MIIKIAVIAVLSFGINVPLGIWCHKFKKFTFPWWLVIHASIPVIIALRIWLNTPRVFIPLFIGLAVLGQFIGSRFKN